MSLHSAAVARHKEFTKRISVPITKELAGCIAKQAEAWGVSEAFVARRLMESAPKKVEPYPHKTKKK